MPANRVVALGLPVHDDFKEDIPEKSPASWSTSIGGELGTRLTRHGAITVAPRAATVAMASDNNPIIARHLETGTAHCGANRSELPRRLHHARPAVPRAVSPPQIPLSMT